MPKKQNIQQNIILLDTSTFSRLNNIITKYPSFKECRFAIGTTTFDELQIGSNERTTLIYRNNIVQLIVDALGIVMWELIERPRLSSDFQPVQRIWLENFLLINKQCNAHLKTYVEGNCKEHDEEVKKLFAISKEYCKQNWIELEQKINSLPKTKLYKNDISEGYIQLFNVIKTRKYNKENHDKLTKEFFDHCSRVIEKEGENRFKERCLTSCIILKIQVFWNLLSVHGKKTQKNKYNNLTSIELDTEKGKITWDKNSFKDLELSAIYLPYITKFVSMDKMQCNLLKFLFPEYENKIYYIPQKELC